MALTPEQIDALDDYSATQMVKLWRHVIAELGSNPEASVNGPNGRAYTLRSLDEAQRMLAYWIAQAAAEAETAAIAAGDYSGLASPTVRFVEAP